MLLTALTFVNNFAPVTTLASSARYRSIARVRNSNNNDVLIAGMLSADIAALEQLLHSQDLVGDYPPTGYVAPSMVAGSSPTGYVSANMIGASSAPKTGHHSSPAVAMQLDALGTCPLGYAFLPGDVPGGDFFGRGFSNEVDTIANCAADCTGRHACLSFEYSPASKNCYLNKVGQPSAANVGSFILCTKTTNTPALEDVIGTVEPVNEIAESVVEGWPAAGNDTGQNVTESWSAAIGAEMVRAAMDAITKPRNLVTFYSSSITEAAGVVIWSLICMMVLGLACLAIWYCCCRLIEIANGEIDEPDDDEDRELHEAWVLSAATAKR